MWALGLQHRHMRCCPYSITWITLISSVQQLNHPCSLPVKSELLEGESWIPCAREARSLTFLALPDHQCSGVGGSHYPEAGEGTRVLGHWGRGGRCAAPGGQTAARLVRGHAQSQTHLQHCRFLSITLSAESGFECVLNEGTVN